MEFYSIDCGFGARDIVSKFAYKHTENHSLYRKQSSNNNIYCCINVAQIIELVHVKLLLNSFIYSNIRVFSRQLRA